TGPACRHSDMKLETRSGCSWQSPEHHFGLPRYCPCSLNRKGMPGLESRPKLGLRLKADPARRLASGRRIPVTFPEQCSGQKPIRIAAVHRKIVAQEYLPGAGCLRLGSDDIREPSSRYPRGYSLVVSL